MTYKMKTKIELLMLLGKSEVQLFKAKMSLAATTAKIRKDGRKGASLGSVVAESNALLVTIRNLQCRLNQCKQALQSHKYRGPEMGTYYNPQDHRIPL